MLKKYIPFDLDWKKEVLKNSKSKIVDMLRKALLQKVEMASVIEQVRAAQKELRSTQTNWSV